MDSDDQIMNGLSDEQGSEIVSSDTGRKFLQLLPV